jgi:hypothetical protein
LPAGRDGEHGERGEAGQADEAHEQPDESVDVGPPAPRPYRRPRRGALLALAGAALVIYFVLGSHWPKDQVVHVVLGPSSPRVTEISLRYAPHTSHKRSASDEDWTREATFRFSEGNAPRVVTHEPRLADGEYDVEIEIQTPSQRSTIDRHATLQGGATSIDVADAVPR